MRTGFLSKRIGRAASVAALAVGLAASPAFAQSVQDPDEQANRSNSVNEIVVTAQKREERLIDVPQSISVVSSDQLARLNATQFRDFANTIPGLSYTSAGAGFTQVSLRGVTVGQDVSPTVGIYADDVPYGSSTGFARGGNLALDVGLFDIDRIEVLRGPQGTLYGASTMGGLIKYVTVQPDTRDVTGGVQAGISSTRFGGVSYNAAAGINVPLATDKAAVRASGFYSHDGGYIDNVFTGRKNADRSNVYGGRLDLLINPTEALSVRLVGFLQDISRDGFSTANFTLQHEPVIGTLEQNFRAEPFEQQFRLLSGTVSYDFGGAELTSISSYQTTDTDFVFARPTFNSLCSLVGTTCSAVGILDRTTTDKFTQEVRLQNGGAGPIDWLVGGFYTNETANQRQDSLLTGMNGQPAAGNLFTFDIPSKYEEYAVFANATWHITDRFEIAGGIRYAENKQRFQQFGTGALGTSSLLTRTKEDVTTYLANARYSLSDRASFYIRYATGYRPGGPNFVILDPATGLPIGTPSFESDSLRSYEAGFKAETSDRTFGIDLAGYFIDWNNIILQVTRNGFSVRTNAAGGAHIMGAELTLTARPTRGFLVTGAFAYQDAKLAAPNADLFAAKGDRLPGVPEFTAAINADYEFGAGSLRPRVGATLRFVDDRLALFSSRTRYKLPSYETLDLRGGVTIDRFDVQLFLRNVFDVRAQVNNPLSSPATGPFLVTLLQPRTVGLSASTRF